jgi:maleate cis-trans isomerase
MKVSDFLKKNSEEIIQVVQEQINEFVVVRFSYSGVNSLNKKVGGTGIRVVSPYICPIWQIECYLMETKRLNTVEITKSSVEPYEPITTIQS